MLTEGHDQYQKIVGDHRLFFPRYCVLRDVLDLRDQKVYGDKNAEKVSQPGEENGGGGQDSWLAMAASLKL